MISHAEFSPDGLYRYVLYRQWSTDPEKKIATCIGLNPSTANATEPDQTITWLIKSLTNLGYAGFYMTNLYGLISPKPEVLRGHPNPWGDNAKWVALSALSSQEVIFCWGNFKEAVQPSKQHVENFPGALCFGRNKNGSPWHPLAMMYKGIRPVEARLESYR